MSLRKTKNKAEIYSDVYSLEWEMNMEWWFDDYYDWYGYGYAYDSYYDYEYDDFEEKERLYSTRVHKSFGRVTIQESLVGAYIDMDQIYQMGSLYYRERMLNRLLGIEKFDDEKKTTIGDYLKDKI